MTVAKEVELADAVQNTGAQLVKSVASKTGDDARDGTATATVLAQTIVGHLNLLGPGQLPRVVRYGL